MYGKPGSQADWARHFELKKKLADGESNFKLVAAILYCAGSLFLLNIVSNLPSVQ